MAPLCSEAESELLAETIIASLGFITELYGKQAAYRRLSEDFTFLRSISYKILSYDFVLVLLEHIERTYQYALQREQFYGRSRIHK